MNDEIVDTVGERKLYFNKIKKQKGITLIALVVTIIVLLILVGISILMLTGENGILTNAGMAKEDTRGANVKEQVDLWKNNEEVDKQSGIKTNTMTEKELLDDLELNQKILLSNERITLETERQVKIGNQIITLNKKITSVYAKLYTDGTLILSSFDYTDSNREIQEDYQDISKNEYGFYYDAPYGEYPGWFNVYYNDRYESYELRGTKCDKVIIYDKIAPENTSYWFSDINEITGIENLDTSGVRNMQGLFSFSSLVEIDLSGFDTSNVTNMSSMFSSCSALTGLDVSMFNTSNVTDMGEMFSYCSNLTDLDVSMFNTSNVTGMYGMFENCSGLSSIDVTGFDTSNVTNMASMFENCCNLELIDISKFTFKSKGTAESDMMNMFNMFSGCSKLTSLGVSVIDLEGIDAVGKMFENCSSLKGSLTLKGKTEGVRNCECMFENCVNLESIEFTDGFLNVGRSGAYAMFRGCQNLKNVKLR